MWSDQAKNPIWCCSHTRQSALMSSFRLTDDLQWPLVLYKTQWRPFQAGHVIPKALNANHLSKIISFHLFIWQSCFWLHRWTRWRESFYRANRLYLCLTSNSLTHHSSWRTVGFLFPRSKMRPVQLPLL